MKKEWTIMKKRYVEKCSRLKRIQSSERTRITVRKKKKLKNKKASQRKQ